MQEVADAHAAATPHVDPLMGVILPLANFAIFLALAIYFFKKPARNAAAKRRQDFERLMAEATAAKHAAEAKLAELEKRRANLDREIADIKEASRQSAENEAAKIVLDAKTVADHLRNEARRIAEAEITKARDTLRREIVAQVKENVTAKIKTELNQDAQLSLVKKQIGALKTVQAEG